jgi:hypothetical protein
MPGTTTGVDVFAPDVSGSVLSTSYLNGIFGDGSDGDAVIAAGAPVTISRDTMYNNLTVPNGATLTPRGFRVFVKGTLTINAGGNINDNGKDAVGVTAGAALNIVSAGFGAASGAGANGRATTGAGASSTTSSNCSINDLNQAPQGGVGGSAGGANTGGTAGAAPPTTILQKWTSLASMWTARCYNGSATFNGGSGGGGGGCDTTAGLASSGGGGSGAGIVWIAAKTIVNNGSITANGGAGANGVSATGVAGGGGGGAGGMIAIITATSTGIGTVTANGGTAGTSVGTGSTAPTAAKIGNVGVIILS